MNRPMRCAIRGFTLVEVLATLVLVAVILPVAMRGVSLCLAVVGDARHKVEAATLAEAKLAELVATDGWQDADLSGDFGDDWPDYAWSADVTERDETAVRQLDLRVAWHARGADRSINLTTLVRVSGGSE